MSMSPEQWNLLNQAQAVIHKLSGAQQRVMAGPALEIGYRIVLQSGYRSTLRVLYRLMMIENSRFGPVTLTALGQKVREVLIGRAS